MAEFGVLADPSAATREHHLSEWFEPLDVADLMDEPFLQITCQRVYEVLQFTRPGPCLAPLLEILHKSALPYGLLQFSRYQ